MTMPNERARALRLAGEILRKLLARDDVPHDLPPTRKSLKSDCCTFRLALKGVWPLSPISWKRTGGSVYRLFVANEEWEG